MSQDDSSDTLIEPDFTGNATDTLEQMQHWTWVMGRAQQMLMEHAAGQIADGSLAERSEAMMRRFLKGMLQTDAGGTPTAAMAGFDPAEMIRKQTDLMASGLDFWGRMMTAGLEGLSPSAATPANDRRFSHEAWQGHPLFSTMRQAYLFIAEAMMGWADDVDGLDPGEKASLRFVMKNVIDAMSPTNFAFTNPEVIEKTLETRGENLLKGLEHMLADLRKGQLTHTDPDAFELGRNIATTPGKVVHETPLYQLIQYAPVTDEVLATPVVVFPPWINRFYILDLNEKKSFVQWATEQGVTLFMVSWKSADASMADVVWDDYVRAQIDAIDTIRDVLGVESVHAIGYCVAGTTLAATLALLHARKEQDKVASATFFTAQVDFENAGELLLFTNDAHMELVDRFSEPGYLDGRYMAATFNALRGRDLIWNYVVSNYLLGEDYPPFDMLHWNGDTTNLPRAWHNAYLTDLYRDNRLAKPGSMSVDGTPVDLTIVETSSYIQAGKEDHIAPAASVFKMMHHFKGDKRFVLAGSGHIAGVVNHPDAGKYQYWINEAEGVDTLDAFVEGASETPGSWWPDWIEWLKGRDAKTVPAKGARIPGKGKRKAIEDAPGRYVTMR